MFFCVRLRPIKRATASFKDLLTVEEHDNQLFINYNAVKC